MATRNSIFISALSLFVVFTSCHDKVPEPTEPAASTLSVTVQPVYGGQLLYLDSTYVTPEGYDIQFTDLKFIFEDIRTTEAQILDAGLFDFRETGTAFFTASAFKESAGSLFANLGVKPSVNHSDPSAFPNESVLNIQNSGAMHWDWGSGYIFMKVEAKVDTIPDGIPVFDHFVTLHVGNDANLQTMSFSTINWQQTGDMSYRFPLKLDLFTFLENGNQSIDVKTEFTSHSLPGQEVLSLKVIENFKAAISPF